MCTSMHIVRFLCPVIGSKLNIIFITILKCCIFACAFSILYCSSSCKSSKTKFQKWFESPKHNLNVTGLEPMTFGSGIRCSTNWATHPNVVLCDEQHRQLLHIYYYNLLQTTEMAAYCTYKLEQNIHTF